VLWTVLWWGTDRLSGFVQWMTVPVIMVGCYGVVRLLGYGRWTGAMVGLLWTTLPQVLYQSSTTQNDLVTASFWWARCTFCLLDCGTGRRSCCIYRGWGLGWRWDEEHEPDGVAWLGVAVLAVLWAAAGEAGVGQVGAVGWPVCWVLVLVGSYGVHPERGGVMGIRWEASTRRRGRQCCSQRGERGRMLCGLRDNLGRYIYQLVDFSPLPAPIPNRINSRQGRVFGALFDVLRLPVESRETVAISRFDLGYINPLGRESIMGLDPWQGCSSSVRSSMRTVGFEIGTD